MVVDGEKIEISQCRNSEKRLGGVDLASSVVGACL